MASSSTIRQRQQPSSTSSSRPYDVIVFGATGFTGQLCAEYLATAGVKNLKYALAGRNIEKLKSVRSDLEKLNPSCKDLDLLVCNSSDKSSLDSVVKQTKVVLTTVGPYSKYGTLLVSSCIENKADYVDLTGEVFWIKWLQDNGYHKRAHENGVAIVNCCGFDSIPSDLGALMIVDHIKKATGKTPTNLKVHTSFTEGQGGVSGGTIASGIEALKQDLNTQFAMMRDPEYLCHPDIKPVSNISEYLSFWKKYFTTGVEYVPAFQRYQGGFIMEMVNAKIVYKSAHLRGDYGPGFTYVETQGLKSFWLSLFMTAFVKLFGLIGLVVSAVAPFTPSPIRTFVGNSVAKMVTQPGSGPSKEVREKGFFKGIVYATAQRPDSDNTQRTLTIRGIVEQRNADPGYKATAKMICESALCLALEDRKAFPKLVDGSYGGVLTPASAMGMVLVERLRKSGMVFKIEEVSDE